MDRVVADANSAGVTPSLTIANIDYTKLLPSQDPKPTYVTVEITGFEMGFIWSLGAPLPEPGGSAPIVAQATMPYMK
jgi:hypothetical protein